MSKLEKFNQTFESLNKEAEKLKCVSGAYKKLEQIVKTFEENSKKLGKINELQETQQEKVSNSLTGIENVNKHSKAELSKIVEERTDQIRKENKAFYKDLESTVKIKLDENKFEIKQLIERERIQIRQIFEMEFAKNNNELRQVIQRENKVVKISIWVIGALIFLLSALAVFKLWAT